MLAATDYECLVGSSRHYSILILVFARLWILHLGQERVHSVAGSPWLPTIFFLCALLTGPDTLHVGNGIRILASIGASGRLTLTMDWR